MRHSIQFPYGRWKSADELIEEAITTGVQICDLLGTGLPADFTQEQLIEAYLSGECTQMYLAHRLGIDLVATRRLLQQQGDND